MLLSELRTVGFLLEKYRWKYRKVRISDLKSRLQVFYFEIIRNQSLNNLDAKGWWSIFDLLVDV